VIDRRGIGTLLVQWKGGSAYLIRDGTARRIERGRPFVSATLTVTKLSAQGDRFDFNMWCGRGADLRGHRERPAHGPADVLS